jgi:hypothetical protein
MKFAPQCAYWKRPDGCERRKQSLIQADRPKSTPSIPELEARMLAIDRWRKWQPWDKKFDDFPGYEPSKPSETTFEGFEGSHPEQMQTFSEPVADAPEIWRKDFARWKAENCIHREGRDDWGGIGCLWVDFCEWAVEHDSVDCDRRTLERLLADDGHRCVEGMVAGLVLRVDLDAALATAARGCKERRKHSVRYGPRCSTENQSQENSGAPGAHTHLRRTDIQ